MENEFILFWLLIASLAGYQIQGWKSFSFGNGALLHCLLAPRVAVEKCEAILDPLCDLFWSLWKLIGSSFCPQCPETSGWLAWVLVSPCWSFREAFPSGTVSFCSGKFSCVFFFKSWFLLMVFSNLLELLLFGYWSFWTNPLIFYFPSPLLFALLSGRFHQFYILYFNLPHS